MMVSHSYFDGDLFISLLDLNDSHDQMYHPPKFKFPPRLSNMRSIKINVRELFRPYRLQMATPQEHYILSVSVSQLVPCLTVLEVPTIQFWLILCL